MIWIAAYFSIVAGVALVVMCQGTPPEMFPIPGDVYVSRTDSSRVEVICVSYGDVLYSVGRCSECKSVTEFSDHYVRVTQ